MIAGLAYLIIEQANVRRDGASGFAAAWQCEVPVQTVVLGNRGYPAETQELDLGIFRGPDATRIEFTTHASMDRPTGTYDLIVSTQRRTMDCTADSPGCGIEAALIKSGLLHAPVHTHVDGIDALVWSNRNEQGTGKPIGIVRPVMGLRRCTSFWQGALKMQEVRATAAWSLQQMLLVGASARCHVLLVRSRESPPNRMDAIGAAGLAFVSTNIERELKSIKAHGGSVLSDPAVVVVNGAPVEIAFVADPEGAPAELIRPIR